MSYKDFSKMIKDVLKNEIELIEKSKISYKDFNRYKILKNSIENFEVIGNLSQNEQIKIINNFIHDLKQNFAKIIKNNDLLNEENVNLSLHNNEDISYFSFIKKLSLIKEMLSNEENIDEKKLITIKNEIYKDMEKLNKYLNNESKESVKEIFELIENNTNYKNNNIINKI
ncbi:hypothetical protein CDX27_08765 [Campylobacter coli]|nr:hypothetical protein [Campylobacter coli]